MMAGKYLCIALFATLQISFVLCRSTGTPDALVEESVKPTGEAVKAEALKQTVVPDTLSKEDFKGNLTYSPPWLGKLSANTRIGIAIGILLFVIGSLIVGCILLCCFPTKPRPGIVLNCNATPVQSGMQHPGNSGQQH